MGIVDLALGIVPAAVQAILLVLLFSRGLHRRSRFPVFVCYTIFSILATALRLTFIREPSFFYLFWGTEVTYGILAILSLNEVFRHIFQMDYEEHWWMHWLLPATTILVATPFLWHALWSYSSLRLAPAILALDLGVHCVEAMILVLFSCLRWLFAAAWSKYDHGVLVGFGVSAYMSMFADTAWAQKAQMTAGWAHYLPSYLPTLGYILAVFIWLRAFWLPPESRPKSQIAVAEVLELLSRQMSVLETIRKWIGRSVLKVVSCNFLIS